MLPKAEEGVTGVLARSSASSAAGASGGGLPPPPPVADGPPSFASMCASFAATVSPRSMRVPALAACRLRASHCSLSLRPRWLRRDRRDRCA